MNTKEMEKNPMPFDGLHEECGVFGMYDFDGGDVASTIYYGLFALQHRDRRAVVSRSVIRVARREECSPIRTWDWSMKCLHRRSLAN